jgi:1,2-diacylglycerol 3-beta-glucosyltransferase
MMTVILIILLSVTGFFTLYLFFLMVVGFFYKSKIKTDLISAADTAEARRIAVIVPAHNEEQVIEKTLTSLFNIDYPTDRFRVIVIADNCTDNTPLIASKKGVIVLERENKNLSGKGYALRWCFELLLKSLKQKFDAFLVVDADTIVSRDILKVMNFYLRAGSQAIQCADLVLPLPGSWNSEMTRVGLYLYNYVRPLGRKILNLSAGLRGNGMCFTKNLIEVIPWQSYSQTEDIEYGMILLLNDVSVTFAPEAKVYAVMPSDPQNAESQRARWEFGRLSLLKVYSSRLLKEAIRKKSYRIFDSLIELITPAFVSLFLITVVLLSITLVLFVTRLLSAGTYVLLFAILLMLQIFFVLGGLYLSKADSNAYKALWKAPKFIFWKFLLYIRLAFNGHTNLWVRTTREEQAK